ncbi:MAG: sigma-70 family RNA polymerase sigma factor [Clostridiales Family XIII bacterium]|jgi:RNA polymerase sigma-70 factor (ECF subfamily)|nr:sigma-70 family RNA polymerase sigma factor [Clostridiales Family XIII bacterium]
MKKDNKFKELYEKYAKFAYHKACRILKQPQDIEDTLQEAWIRIYNNMDKIDMDSEARAQAYIGRIVANECYRLLGKNNPANSDMESIDGGFNELEDISASVEAAVIAKEGMEELKAALDGMKETDRHIFTMKNLDGMKNKEIADLFGLGAEYVGMRLSRISKKLAKSEVLKRWVKKDED